MPHGRRDEEEEGEFEEEEEEERPRGKRGRSDFIDDSAIEDDEEDEEEDDEDEEYGGDRGRKPQKRQKSRFIDDEAIQDTDDDEEEEDGDEGIDFINDDLPGADQPDTERGRSRRPILMQEAEEDVDEIERQVYERYSKPAHHDDIIEDEGTEVEQQALLPSVRDPKLWMVKCAIGHERETAICLMQKSIDRPDLLIKSAIALDHLKNYIYIEAEKEAHVKEACKGLRNIYSSAKVTLVPIKEMTDVLSVESKSVDLTRDTWVRMKLGVYKGDLAKIVDVDNVRQKVTVKLIPRIDLQALANKLDGARDIGKKKAFVPPPRFFNIEEARNMNIRVERRRDKDSGDHFEMVDQLMFKDGFLYKTVSVKSISRQNIQPSLDELEKFRKPGDDDNGDANLSTLFATRKKGHFMKGDAVIVVRGDLKNLMGWVEKVEEGTIYVKPKMSGLPKTLAFNDKELCKYFQPGDHVKVVSGVKEGATGMVVKVEGHVLIVLSDTTKEDIRVFADHVVESSEITTGVTKIGDYELHDLVLLGDSSFGVIIDVEKETCRVLKGVPDRPQIVLVRLREIKSKIDRRTDAQDRTNNRISVKDVVKILEGPYKNEQGVVEQIHRGILFIYNRNHSDHTGFLCAKAQSCVLIGGSRGGNERNGVDSLNSRFASLRSPSHMNSPRRGPSPRGPPADFGGRNRGGREHNSLIGKIIKIRSGPLKGYRGRVKEITGTLVRVELDSQMKIVTVKRDEIADTAGTATPFRESRLAMGSETPMHSSKTPLHPFHTPMRDGATPLRDGMRTPRRDAAWAPMSPPREAWEDGNPASWATPQYQPGTPRNRPYEAPTPGSGWANTPGGNFNDSATPRESSPRYGSAASPYVPSTPEAEPMTPSAASYLPGTPGGQPMTPGNVGDIMSPTIGGEGEGTWFVPDILVNVVENSLVGVVKEVLGDGSYKVGLGASGNGETLTLCAGELEAVRPKKSDKIKILSGSMRGFTGKLIGIDGSDGIVKLDDTFDVKILDMVILAKLATQ